MSLELSESDIEEIIARHPGIIEKGLTLKGRQVTFRGKRVDLIFKDRFGATLLVELKKGVVKQKDVGQLMDYLGLVGQQEGGRIRIMLIGSVIPKLRRNGMGMIGIEYREISNQDYIKFLRNRNPKLLEKLQKRPLKPIITPKKLKERAPTSIEPLKQRFWIFQTNPKRYAIFGWWRDFAPVEDTFWVKQHRDEIHKGDMVATWVARGNREKGTEGIYAIAEILTDPEMKMVIPEKLPYFHFEEDRQKLSKEPRLEVRIRYIKSLLSRPILISNIKDDPILSELSILKNRRLTNYPVTPEQWQRIMELAGLTS